MVMSSCWFPRLVQIKSSTHRLLAQRTPIIIPTAPRANKTFLLKNSNKRLFHASSRTQISLHNLPESLVFLKSTDTAFWLNLCFISSLTGSLYKPFKVASKFNSPRVRAGLKLCTAFSFGALAFLGFENAPNTGRWRFTFLSRDKIRRSCTTFRQEISVDLEERQRKEDWAHDNNPTIVQLVPNQNDKRVKMAKRILDKMVHLSLESDGVTLKRFLCDIDHEDGAPGASEEQIAQGRQHRKPGYNIDVSLNSDFNAYACEPGKIVIYDGVFRLLKDDENLVAAVVAHELAHLIQGHLDEREGRKVVMAVAAGISNHILIAARFLAQVPMEQGNEKEADILSLSIMGLAGYDPQYVLQIWKIQEEAEALKKKNAASLSPSKPDDDSGNSRSSSRLIVGNSKIWPTFPWNRANDDAVQASKSGGNHSEAPWWIRSHPLTKSRIEYIQNRIEPIRQKWIFSETIKKIRSGSLE
ncbi:hypothetical protein BGW38_002301 [Lunasporangiospora selenospora]|uniref:Peptidase M48 domain-containing protein n=1 Tax=Lunasporangiospora selenospora TaxID=979761 RepID=A0A9P6FS91_9FUNG|nr:hypothetical protein BGW38_002301 [Lunasporangiospora selenospora]